MSTPTPAQAPGRDAWEAIAPAFDQLVTPLNLRYGEMIVDRLGVQPGTRLLDVAAGSGAVSIPAARRGAEVLAVDLAPTMIERLAARARAEGLANLAGRVMDGTALTLGDGSVDVAASLHGVSTFPDLDGGLREMVRVTRGGGTVLVAAFGALAKAEFLGFVVNAIRAAVPGFAGPPMDPPPLPFQLASPDRFRQALTAAGLSDVVIESVTWDMPFRSGAHLWDAVAASNPIGARLVGSLSAPQAADARQVLDGLLRERSGGEPGAVLHVEVNLGSGTV